jgi:hypothetical protein
VLAATDSIVQAFSKLQGQLNAKADYLGPVPVAGTTVTITKAGHSNREVILQNVAANTVTFDLTGMDASDGGRLKQAGGSVTIGAGVTVLYSGGVSNTPTIPDGVGNWLDWEWASPGEIRITAKSEDAVGAGGGSTVQTYTAIITAPTNGNENGPLAAISLPDNLPANTRITTTVIGDYGVGAGNAGLGGGQWTVTFDEPNVTSPITNSIGIVPFAPDNVSTRSRTIRTFIISPTSQRNILDGDAQGVDPAVSATTFDTSSANTLHFYAQRFNGGDNTRVATARIFVEVIQP